MTHQKERKPRAVEDPNIKAEGRGSDGRQAPAPNRGGGRAGGWAAAALLPAARDPAPGQRPKNGAGRLGACRPAPAAGGPPQWGPRLMRRGGRAAAQPKPRRLPVQHGAHEGAPGLQASCERASMR